MSYSDFLIFDSIRINRAHARFIKKSDFLLRFVYDRLTENLHDIERHFPLAFCTDVREVFTHPKINHIFTLGRDFIGLEEALPLRHVDLIISCLSLHTTHDLLRALSQIRQSLAPGGVFLAALFTQGTLETLTKALADAQSTLGRTPALRVVPFPEIGHIASLLGRAGFAMPVVDREYMRVCYSDIWALMRDLRNMGEGNPFAHPAHATRGLFDAANALYPRNKEGHIEAVFEIAFCIGWSGLRSPTLMTHKKT